MRKVAKAAPDNIIAHKVLGQIALAQGSLPDAEKSFRMVVLLDPHDKEAKQALADIGAGGPARQSRRRDGRAARQPAAPRPRPPRRRRPRRSRGAKCLDGGAPLQGLELHRAPGSRGNRRAAARAFPHGGHRGRSARRSSWRSPTRSRRRCRTSTSPPPTAGEAPSPQPGAAGDRVAERRRRTASVRPEVPPPIDVPALELPEPAAGGESPSPSLPPRSRSSAASRPASSLPAAAAGVAARSRLLSRAATETPAEDESPFEIFGRPKRGGPAGSPRGSARRTPRSRSSRRGTPPWRASPMPIRSPSSRSSRGSPASGGRRAQAGRAASAPAFEQIELEPTAYVPPEPQEGEPPVIELREEIPRIDMQSELELALEMERAPADAVIAEPVAEDAVAPIPLWQRGARGLRSLAAGLQPPPRRLLQRAGRRGRGDRLGGGAAVAGRADRRRGGWPRRS